MGSTNGSPMDIKIMGVGKKDMKCQSREVGPGLGGIKVKCWGEYDENTL